MSDHAAVSAEAAAFRARMSEAGRALTGPGVDHALMYGGTRKAAPEPASPHKMRPAGSDRVSINGGVEHTPKQKKHFESHISSEHVDAAFKVGPAKTDAHCPPATALHTHRADTPVNAILLRTHAC